MIRLFKRDPMTYTPFDYPESLARLAREGIELTQRIREADIVISRGLRRLRSPRLKYPWKLFLVWTHEPRFDTHLCQRVMGPLGLANVEIMNVYTRDIFCDNFDVLGDVIERPLEPLTDESFCDFRHKKIAALMTHQTDSLLCDGRELSLFERRSRIALAGHAAGKVEIFGRGWPAGISREDSRGDGWHERKIELLKNYHFNLCFENTTFDYYCSEKIWDSIRAGCLPIYFSQGNRIYDDFPPDSFVDYCELDSPQRLFALIDAMTPGEFCRRMNRCIDVFNRLYERRAQRTYYDGRFSEQLMQRIVGRILAIAGRSADRNAA